MNKIKSIDILGQPFAVTWVDHVKSVLLEDNTAVGATNVSEQRIDILARDQGPHQERDTVLHEVLHAILKLTAHRDSFSSGADEEKVVYATSTALLTVMRANPELVAYLTENLEGPGE